MVRLITILLAVLIACGQYVSYAQEFTPLVRLYDREDYHADNQTWGVSSSDDGYIYFGNGAGMLTYDGYRWTLDRIPGNKLVRSVFAEGDRVYVGSHEQFGYFVKTIYGTFEYHSLSEDLSGYQMQNDEIWRIIKVGDKIVFQSFTSFFVYDGQNVFAHRMPSVCLFFVPCGDSVLTSTEDQGLVFVDIDTGAITPLDNVPFDSQLVSLVPYSDGRYMTVTYSDGLYLYDGEEFIPFKTEIDDKLASWQPNYVFATSYGDLVIGTKLKGAVCINSRGQVEWTVNQSNVLGCNTVLGIDADLEGNLWLALDGGVAMIQSDPSLAYIGSISPSVGSIYTLFYQKPHLYMGTGQGLYVGELSEDLRMLSNVRPVKEILGNVWHIDEVDGQLFCGTNYETFDISRERASVLSHVVGGSCMDHGVINGKDVLVQGTYTYPCIYTRKFGKWTFSHALKDFVQPLSEVEIDHSGTIWASHLYKGLYAIRLTDDLSAIESVHFYSSMDGKNDAKLRVYSVNSRVIFIDEETGFYTYDYLRDQIVPYQELNDILSDSDMSYTVCHFNDDLYWFISSSRAVLIRFNGKEPVIEDTVPYRIFGGSILDERQTITPISENDCLIALGNSLALYCHGVMAPDTEIPEISVSRVSVRDVSAQIDSLLPTSPADIPEVPSDFRNITVDFHHPHFAGNDVSNYTFRIDQEPWSSPVSIPSVSYSYLKKGRHLIEARLCTETGEVLAQTDYEFRITIPFYKSTVAVLIYFILIAAACGFGTSAVIRARRAKKMEAEKEELELQIRLKSKELAASTMNVIRKNEILINIKKELDTGKIDKAISIIEGNLASDQEWKMFETNFDNIHERFFRKLRERYPALTENDLRFCAYLRLNLSSKDIASLMNISLKGVEAARARIRKKISLPSSQSLTTFMIELK